MNASTPTARLGAGSIAVIAAMLALALFAGAALSSFVSGANDHELSQRPLDGSTLQVEYSGGLRDLIADDHKDEFDAYMADAGNRQEYLATLQESFGDEQAAASEGTAGVQNVLAYGFDRDHVWVTLSYADVAKGLISAAVAYCKTRIPAFICTAAGTWLKSLAQGYGPLANHGVWGSLYVNRYAGGRW